MTTITNITITLRGQGRRGIHHVECLREWPHNQHCNLWGSCMIKGQRHCSPCVEHFLHCLIVWVYLELGDIIFQSWHCSYNTLSPFLQCHCNSPILVLRYCCLWFMTFIFGLINGLSHSFVNGLTLRIRGVGEVLEKPQEINYLAYYQTIVV